MRKTTTRSLLAATVVVAAGSMAQAAGTAAGTIVTNTVSLTYESGGQTVTDNNAAEAAFVVDRKIDFTIAGQDAGKNVTVDAGVDQAVLSFRITNEGNDTQGFDVDALTSGDTSYTFNPAGAVNPDDYTIYVSDDALFNPATDALYNPAGLSNVGDVAADGFFYVFIVANVSSTNPDGFQDSFTVTARALNPGTNSLVIENTGNGLNAIDTVFADGGFDNTESDTETLTIAAPILAVTKVAVVVNENRAGGFDCANGVSTANQTAIPGACISYVLTVTNDAAASTNALNISLADAMPANVDFVALINIASFDTATYSAGTDTVNATKATLAPGASASLEIRATVR